jgi:hypothetical protein
MIYLQVKHPLFPPDCYKQDTQQVLQIFTPMKIGHDHG